MAALPGEPGEERQYMRQPGASVTAGLGPAIGPVGDWPNRRTAGVSTMTNIA